MYSLLKTALWPGLEVLLTRVMALTLLLACQAFAANDKADDKATGFVKVAPDVWVMHGPLELPNPQNRGFMNNPGLVKTSAGLVIIDPGSSVQVGRRVLAAARAVSTQPVVAVFNTHVHGDHWLGNQAIREAWPKAVIYAHPEMIREIADGEGKYWVELMDRLTEGATRGTEVVAPDRAVNDGDVIIIGDKHFRLYHYGHVHTKTDLMIEVVESQTIFLGDNVLAKRLPRMTDGSFSGSLRAIDEILKRPATTWVPGHGPTGGRDMVKAYRRYLQAVYDAAKKAFDEDLDSSDVLRFSRPATRAFSDWAGYEDELPRHGAQAYAEIEAAEF